MADITLLPSAKVPLIYDGELTMTTEWYRFFWNIYGFTGTGVVPVNKGGTGLNTIGDHQLIIGNANNVFEPAILTGNGITISYAPGIVNLAIGASGVTPGTYGSASKVGQFIIDQFGVITFAQDVNIAINASQIISGTIASARISGSYTGITGVGTLTSGTWNANTISTVYGGTGLTSLTAGQIPYGNGTSPFSSSANFTFNGSKLLVTTASGEVATFNALNKIIDSTGNVQIFTGNPQAVDLGGSLALGGLNGSAGAFDPWAFGVIKGAKSNSTSSNLAGYLAFATANSGGTIGERLRIDSAGSVLVKQTGSYDPTNGTAFPTLQVSTFLAGTPFGLFSWSNDAVAPALRSSKSRGTTEGSYTIVQNDDVLLSMVAYGADGTKFVQGASIQARVDGTPGVNDMPTRLMFSTTADGASVATERMRITNAGGVSIGNTTDPGASNLSVSGTIRTQGYTVATLPAAGTVGRKAYVTDALAPTFLTAVVGGGAITSPVFDNGTAWVAG